MDPATAIVAALAAGASAGVSETTSTAVHDAYSVLRDGVRRRLASRSRREATKITDAMLADPRNERENLVRVLAESGADEDASLVAAAQRLLRLADPGGHAAGKYAVDLRGARGVQVGDGNVQVNHFS